MIKAIVYISAEGDAPKTPLGVYAIALAACDVLPPLNQRNYELDRKKRKTHPPPTLRQANKLLAYPYVNFLPKIQPLLYPQIHILQKESRFREEQAP